MNGNGSELILLKGWDGNDLISWTPVARVHVL